MISQGCTHQDRKKHGKTVKGQQRWKCRECGATFLSDEARPLGDMRTTLDDAERVLQMLLEGMSIRACSRITGIKADTICDLVLHVGQNCERFLAQAVRNVPAKVIEMDELWGFVGLKAKTKVAKGYTDDRGDSWTWLAIDADTKLVLAHHVGLREENDCHAFLKRLNNATIGECQVTSDGLRAYTHNVPFYMGSRVKFAQLVKNYSNTQAENRYSPAAIIGAEKTPRFGDPDPELISTSYSERLNLSVRMHNRRFTRLTNAHSKTTKHHAAAVALFVAWYNFCRRNMALDKNTTPAMGAGLTTVVWTLKDLMRAAS